ncbi:MAG: hypothetical protein LBG74_03180 [Spirochaetaceae bacterium]|nr:hypothetical protein [Spirochaetaceae bacterium]
MKLRKGCVPNAAFPRKKNRRAARRRASLRIIATVAFFLRLEAAFAQGFHPSDAETSRAEKWARFWLSVQNYWLYTPDNTTHHIPARDFEVGGHISAGFGWDFYLGLLDVFKKNTNIHINMNELIGTFSGAYPKGINIGAEMEYQPVYIKMKKPLNRSFGFSLFNISSRIDINISDDFINFFAKGNIENHNITPAIIISGALFTEIVSFEWKRQFFRDYYVTLRPSWYIPLFYIPKSEQKLQITAQNNFQAELKGGANVYIPFSFSDGFQITNFGGIDADLIIERPLFNILDIGLELLHLPLMPSVLSNVGEIGFEGIIVKTGGISMENFDFNIPALDQFYHTKNFWVFRPLTTGLYLLYRPFGSDRWYLRPNFGCVFLTPGEQIYINAGLETSYMFTNFFRLTFFTGLRDGFARNSFEFIFGGKRFGMYLKLDLRSQDYLRSWTLKGAGISIGYYAGK